MAKGLRASTKKANRTNLRSRVFGPVEEARKERLSAKLLELASKPRTVSREDVKMTDEHKGWGSLNVTRSCCVALLTPTLFTGEKQQKESKIGPDAAEDTGSIEEG